jgi:excisionase family DNA binding protein
MTGQLRDIAAYAALLGVPATWVRDKVTARELEFTKVGRHVRFSDANHEANLAAWRQRPIATVPALTSVGYMPQRRRSA